MSRRTTDDGLKTEGFRGVKLTEADAHAGLLLSTEAGWNQTATDWSFLLRHGQGVGFETQNGQLAASAVLMPYDGRLAWISLVLVTAAARRRGLATQLLNRLVALGTAQGLDLFLDATPEGQEVYRKIGFRAVHGLTRWKADNLVPEPSAALIRPLEQIADWHTWDAMRFGTDRSITLDYLQRERHAQNRQLLGAHDEKRGYLLLRPGRTSTHLGPLVAETEPEALTLLQDGLGPLAGSAIIDLKDGHPRLEQLLQRRGFTRLRPFTRMIHGPAREGGRPACLFAAAGPEFG